MRILLLIISITIASMPLGSAQERVQRDGSIITVGTPQSDQIATLLEAYEAGEFDDIAAFKLAVDKTIDPNTPVDEILAVLDRAVETIRVMAGPDADEAKLYRAMQRFIYEPGVWNENRAFAYDLDDPLGQQLESKLLGNYLLTRRGNCVSMPQLVLILGRKLGMDMTLAYAPNHMYVKFKPDGHDDYINIEATSGANPASDEWIRQQSPPSMTEKSISNGAFMRPLTEMELAAGIAATALEHAFWEARHWETIRMARIIESYDKTNVSAMLFEANGFMGLMEEDYHRQFPDPNRLPPGLYDRYSIYAQKHRHAIERSARLGFSPGTVFSARTNGDNLVDEH